MNLTRLHVRTTAPADRVSSAIAAHLEGEGFEPASDAGDREYRLYAHPERRWQTVTSNACGEPLAEALSQALQADVLLVRIIHSDMLELQRFSGGECRARYFSHPEELDREERPQWALRPEEWSPLLAPGVEGDQVTSDLMPPVRVHGEELLARVARLFGFGARATACGTLGFARADGRAAARISGPPSFRAPEPAPVVEGRPTEPLVVALPFTLEGGAGTGLDVVIWGKALRKGLVTPGEARAVVRHGASVAHSAPLLEGEDDDGALLRATLDDYPIPAALDWMALATLPDPARERQMASCVFAVEVELQLAFGEPGRATLDVTLVPHEDDDGQDTVEVRVRCTT